MKLNQIASALMVLSLSPMALADFTIQDIRVEGLQRTEPIALKALLEEVCSSAQSAGAARRVQVLLDAPADATVDGDRLLLRRAVANLLDNALKFAGSASIEVEPLAQGLSIRVLDRGPGIPADQLQAVMLPFARLEPSRSRETGGVGLGLAIARQLALALGGELRLGNREGGGLRAELLLPAQPLG